MLVLDGVYVENDYGGLRFHRVKAPNVDELKSLVHAISHRVARFLEKRGFLERDADDCMDAGGRATHGAVAETRRNYAHHIRTAGLYRQAGCPRTQATHKSDAFG